MPRLDRERRWRMCQLRCNLLEDLYPQGIDKGPSYRGMAIRAQKAHKPQAKIIPIEPEHKLKDIE